MPMTTTPIFSLTTDRLCLMIRTGSTIRDIMKEIQWLWEGPSISDEELPAFAEKLAADLARIAHELPTSELLQAEMMDFVRFISS